MAYNIQETLRLFGNEIHFSEVAGTQRLYYPTAGNLVFDADGKSITLESDEANSKSAIYLDSAAFAIGSGFSGTGTGAWVNTGLISLPSLPNEGANPSFTGINIDGNSVLWTYNNSIVSSLYDTSLPAAKFPLFLSVQEQSGDAGLIGVTNVVAAGMDYVDIDQSSTLFTQRLRLRSELNYTDDYRFLTDQSSSFAGHLGLFQETIRHGTSVVDSVAATNEIHISGDWTGQLEPGRTFRVTGSININGTWTVVSSSYNAPNTEIIVSENVPVDSETGTASLIRYPNDLWLSSDPDANYGGGGNFLIEDNSIWLWLNMSDFSGGEFYITGYPTSRNVEGKLRIVSESQDAYFDHEIEAGSGGYAYYQMVVGAGNVSPFSNPRIYMDTDGYTVIGKLGFFGGGQIPTAIYMEDIAGSHGYTNIYGTTYIKHQSLRTILESADLEGGSGPGVLRFESAGSGYIEFDASLAITNSYVLTWPGAAPVANNSALVWTTGGQLDWYDLSPFETAPAKASVTFTPGTVGVANTINHNLGTADIIVQLWDVTTGAMVTAQSIDNVTTTQVDITFGTNPAGDVKAVMMG